MAEEKKPTGRGRKKKNPETADAAKKSTAASTKKTTKATTAKAPAKTVQRVRQRAGGPGGTYPGGKRADDGGAGNLNKTNPEGGKKNVTGSIRNG